MATATNTTVKEHLEEHFVLDDGFWYETHIDANKLWCLITIYELDRIALALDENVCKIINPNF